MQSYRQESAMTKPNYQFEKRQRDLAKKKKQDEKRSRKLSKDETPAVEGDAAAEDQSPAPAESTPG
jgi:hypothetical protein